jgi:predicted ATPase
MSGSLLRLLGAPVFEDETGALRFAPERVFQVIAYLAYRGDWVQRGALAALFYGDHPEEAARRNLRKLLLRARGFAWFDRAVEATRDSVRLNLATDVRTLAEQAREKNWAAILATYRGRLLDGLDAPECRGYSEWLATERDRLQALWRDAAFATLRSKDPREAIQLSTRLIEADPLDESAWRAHLEALSADGQALQAQRAYRTYAARLARELGVEPSADLRALFETAATETAPATRAAPVRAQPDDGFVGRIAELQQIAALIAQDDCRLLNLVGPGGVGKSSLARRVLRDLDPARVGRTGFVALEDVTTSAEIGARLARDLGIRLAGNAEALPQVANALRDTTALIVLDNFEHLAGDASAITFLLDQCPLLKLIVTSRVRLAIGHEWLLPLEGLPYPAPEDDDRADAFDAVRLFVRAARRVRPTFSPASEDVALVEICRLVEGLPLALEITAAWTRVLSCAAIVVELKRGTELLRTPDGARPARQASIEAVFEHSWNLLAPAERDALARLSIFRSAVTRATARAVTAASLPVFAALADKSLLQIAPQDRCSLHPLVHRFAGEKLQQQPGAALAVARRHSEHYCRLLGDYASMEAVDQGESMQRVIPELADATAAITWARAHDRWELVGPGALVLSQIFDLAGRPREGLIALEPLTTLPAPSTRAQARSLAQVAIGFATLYQRLAHFTAATQCAERALRNYRGAADSEGVRMALSILSTTSLKLGRHAESRRYCEHGLKSAAQAGDQIGIGTFLNNLGQVDNELGDWDSAIKHFERAFEVNRAASNQVGLIAQLNNLARAHIGAGRHERARALLLKGLKMVDAAGFGALRNYFLHNLARASFETGQLEESQRFADEGLEAARAVSDMTNVPGLLIVLADLALARRQLDAAQGHVREAAQVTRSTQHRRWVVPTLLAQARLKRAAADDCAAALITAVIQASPITTALESADAQKLERELAAAATRENRGKHPSVEQLLAEVADGR